MSDQMGDGLKSAGCYAVQKPCMRNNPAANWCGQVYSLTLPLLENLINVVFVTSSRDFLVVNNQGCAREISLARDGSPCRGNQFIKLNLECQRMANEVEGQP